MRVLLTRQPAQAGDLEAGLAGAEVAGRRLRVGFLPLTDFALPDDDGPLRALLADWAGADGDAAGPVRSDGSRWLVLTSANTVRALRAVGWDGHVPAGARIAATGPGTARVLTEAGCDAAPWLPPEDRSAEGLIAGLAALHPRGARAWLPQSDRARPASPTACARRAGTCGPDSPTGRCRIRRRPAGGCSTGRTKAGGTS